MDGAIVSPHHPNHFMVLRPIERRIIIRRGDMLLADSTNAIRLMEAGRSLYDPVIYLPFVDVKVRLERQEKSTHCPLKGDASYFALGGDDPVDEIAWSYEETLPIAAALKGLIAFYPSLVSIEEHPLGLAA